MLIRKSRPRKIFKILVRVLAVSFLVMIMHGCVENAVAPVSVGGQKRADRQNNGNSDNSKKQDVTNNQIANQSQIAQGSMQGHALPSGGEAAQGFMLVPVTAFSNMENGYQATNDGFRIILKNQAGQIISAGPLGIDAMINSYPIDSQNGAYNAQVMNAGLTFIAPEILNGSHQGQFAGNLSICLADDPSSSPEVTKCKTMPSGGMSPVDRPFQWIDTPVKYSVSENNIKIERYLDQNTGEGSEYAKALATHHPVFGFAAPGTAFKDYQSPLVLDCNDNNRFDLIDVWDKDDVVAFDLSGQGQKIRTGWVRGSDGFLALDVDNNGVIDNGTELFGEYSSKAGFKKKAGDFSKNYENGFLALGQYDLNHDGKIDKNDLIFKRLVVWQDLNRDGISEKKELRSLAEMKIREINLAYKATDFGVKPRTILGNEVRLQSYFVTGDGKKHNIADIWFKQRRYSSNEQLISQK